MSCKVLRAQMYSFGSPVASFMGAKDPASVCRAVEMYGSAPCSYPGTELYYVINAAKPELAHCCLLEYVEIWFLYQQNIRARLQELTARCNLLWLQKKQMQDHCQRCKFVHG